jgi:serine peptidase DegS
MQNKQSIVKFILQSIVAGLAMGFLIVFFNPEFLYKDNSQIVTTSVQPTNSYATAVTNISPSVVSIYAQGEERRPYRISKELQKFMGLKSLVPETVTQQYLGSGVIVTTNGYIVTNFHVIKNATQIIVSLWDGQLLEAKVIGADQVTDIAVLKIEAIDLKPAVFADSDTSQTGDVVLAIGNPYGLSQSVTLGIISAKGRSGLDVSTIEDFIQTDAAINEGNSGGALINTSGQLVGISTATFNNSGAQGINFAIPSNATKLIMEEILKNGRVLRGWLGIEPFTPKLFYQTGLIKPNNGVVIYGVYPQYPAMIAGLKSKDIITHINEVRIQDDRHYREIIALSKPGETLIVKGYSQGKEFEMQIQTVERPAQLLR